MLYNRPNSNQRKQQNNGRDQQRQALWPWQRQGYQQQQGRMPQQAQNRQQNYRQPPQAQAKPTMFSPQQMANGALPDGITLQPIDQGTMAHLGALMPAAQPLSPQQPSQQQPYQNPGQTHGSQQNAGNLPHAQPPAVNGFSEANGVVAPQPVQSRINSDKLRDFIQNERNAGLFYEHLAARAPEHHRQLLRELRDESSQRRSRLEEIFRQQEGQEIQIRESDINDNLNYRDGINLAILEESRAIKELSSVCDTLHSSNDELSARRINSILYKKIGDLGILWSMKN